MVIGDNIFAQFDELTTANPRLQQMISILGLLAAAFRPSRLSNRIRQAGIQHLATACLLSSRGRAISVTLLIEAASEGYAGAGANGGACSAVSAL